jgi:hypothetical protein
MPPIDNDKFDVADASAAYQIYRADRRQRLTAALPQIAAEVTAALANANIRIPIFFSVPSSGGSLLTFATPVDPTEYDWDAATALICEIVGRKVGIEHLYSRHIPCVAAGLALDAADVSVATVHLSADAHSINHIADENLGW